MTAIVCPFCGTEFKQRAGSVAPESWRGVRQRLWKHYRKKHPDEDYRTAELKRVNERLRTDRREGRRMMRKWFVTTGPDLRQRLIVWEDGVQKQVAIFEERYAHRADEVADALNEKEAREARERRCLRGLEPKASEPRISSG